MMAIDSSPRSTLTTGLARWPVDWSAVWVGALSAVVVGLIVALLGVALGMPGSPARIVHWKQFGFGSLVFAVFGAFLSFVVGGWAAGRIAGYARSEPSILHGAIVWLVGVSLMVAMSSAGASFGPWYRGAVGFRVPPVSAPVPGAPDDPDTARAARNAALGGVAALLLGLVGAAIGGWMASGEPMTLTYYRSRERRPA